MLCDPFIASKVHNFSSSYRPKSLEERIRRAHVKQLQGQIDFLGASELSSAIDVQELVRLNEIERAEKAAQAAALLEAQVSVTETENEVDADGNPVTGRPRGNSMQLLRKPSMRKQNLGDSRPPSTMSQRGNSCSESSNAIDVVSKTGLNADMPTDLPSPSKFDAMGTFVSVEEESFDDIDDFNKSPVNKGQSSTVDSFSVPATLQQPIAHDVKEGIPEEEDDETGNNDTFDDKIDTGAIESSQTRINGGRIGQAIAEAQDIDKQLADTIF
jgi:hypothetical protein